MTETKRRPETRGRPTLYKGIRMRSRLEADFAAALDKQGAYWEYEPECFAGPTGQWLPDFRVRHPGGASAPSMLVEVKPASMMQARDGEQESDVIARIDEILARTAIAWFSEPETQVNVVFWTWGADVPDLDVAGSHTGPWYAKTPHYPFRFLWPGAAQASVLEWFAGEASQPEPEEAAP